MTLVEWNQKMSVGVSIIDDEHKKLVGMLNELHDAIDAKQTDEVLGKVLDKMVAYTVYHCKHEESLFARSDYADATQHAKEHADLTKQVLDMQKRCQDGATATLSTELLNFLKIWLLAHILRSDKKFVPHLKAIGIN